MDLRNPDELVKKTLTDLDTKIIQKRITPQGIIDTFVDMLADLDSLGRPSIIEFDHRFEEIYHGFSKIEKELFWEKRFQTASNSYSIGLFLDQILTESTDLDFKRLIDENVSDNKVKEQLHRNFFSLFFSHISDHNSVIQIDLPKATVNLDKILPIHDIEGYPKGKFTNLSSYNVIIGKNNQIKTRTLKVLHQITKIIQSGQVFGNHSVSKESDPKKYQYKDRDIAEGLQQEFKIGLTLIHNYKIVGTKKLFGWEFPIRQEETVSIELTLKRDFILIDSHNSDLEQKKLIQLLRENIKPFYFSDRSTVLDPESFPKGGWEDYELDDQDFEKNFRSIIYYILDHQIHTPLNLTRYLASGEQIIEIARVIIHIRTLYSIFDFRNINIAIMDERYSDIINVDLTVTDQENVILARQMLEEYGFNFDLEFDRKEGLIKFDISKGDNINEIAEHGHGIRKIILLLLSSLFMNVIFIDELENGLHPGLQNSISRFLLALPNVQKFIVTHSPTLIRLDTSTRVYTIENNTIINRMVFSDSYQGRHKLYRQYQHIRNLTGSTLESLLFKSSILFVEGKDDNRFFYELFNDLKPNCEIVPMKDVSSFKKNWKDYLKRIEKFDQSAYFIFDGDYFNRKTVHPDNRNCFVLPCYSYESLFFDDKFLSTILHKPLPIIQRLILTVIEGKKQTTLDNLLLADLYQQSPLGHIKSFIDSNPLDWNKLDEHSIYTLIKNLNEEKRSSKLEMINHTLFKQLDTRPNIKSLIKTNQIDLDEEAICELTRIPKLKEIEVIKSFSKVKKIANDWDNRGVKYVSLKDDCEKSLRFITDGKMKIKDVKKELITYLSSALTKDRQPEGTILKDFWTILKALNVR